MRNFLALLCTLAILGGGGYRKSGSDIVYI